MAEKKQWHETLHDQFGQYFAVDNVLSPCRRLQADIDTALGDLT